MELQKNCNTAMSAKCDNEILMRCQHEMQGIAKHANVLLYAPCPFG